MPQIKNELDRAFFLEKITYVYTLYDPDKSINPVEYLNESLQIREKILGKEHPECANSLNALGLLFDHIG